MHRLMPVHGMRLHGRRGSGKRPDCGGGQPPGTGACARALPGRFPEAGSGQVPHREHAGTLFAGGHDGNQPLLPSLGKHH